jgi:hypothetical protein
VLQGSGSVVAEGALEDLTALASDRLGNPPSLNLEEIFLALT